MKPKKTYVPENIQELLEFVVSMQLSAPRFFDQTGYLPFLNLDEARREFEAVRQGRRRFGYHIGRWASVIRWSEELQVTYA